MTADLNISTTNTNTHSFPTGSYVEIFSMGKGNETKVYSNESCIIVEANNNADFVAAKDRLIYGMLGIIK